MDVLTDCITVLLPLKETRAIKSKFGSGTFLGPTQPLVWDKIDQHSISTTKV